MSASSVQSQRPSVTQRLRIRGLVVIAVLVAAAGAVAAVRMGGPRPRALEAAATEFSAARAQSVLRDILGDQKPHPVGSPEAQAVRERIVAQLRSLGYAPRVERGFACSRGGNCAWVNNVVASSEPGSSSRAILLAVHYDSVAAGPGASDDGAGVAVALEIARILKVGPPRRNPILFLFDEGEEAGLLGAEAFVAAGHGPRDIAAVINLEARGTEGPSLMFESGPRSGWLIRELARAVPRPASSSLMSLIYERLPNNTDFSVFRRAGIEGLNFAWIGGVTRYHTPLDDLAHQSPRSLQHHGDNALAMLRALADLDLDDQPAGSAVHFDLFQSGLVRWPLPATVPAAILALVLALAAAVLLVGRWQCGGASVAWGVVGFLAWLVGGAVSGLGVATLLRAAGAAASDWPAHPLPLQIASLAAVVTVVFAVARLFAARAGTLGLLAGGAVTLAAFSVARAVAAPRASFLTLPAALAMATALVARATTGAARFEVVAAGLGGIVSAVIAWPHVLLLHDGLGAGGLVVSGVLVAIVLGSFAPLSLALSRPAHIRLCIVMLAATVSALVLAVSRPPYSTESPRALNLVRLEDPGQGLSLFVAEGGKGPLPSALQRMGPWKRPARPPLPWAAAAERFVMAAEALAHSPPRLEVIQSTAGEGHRQVRVRLRPGSGGSAGGLSVAAAHRIEAITVEGWKLDPARCTLPSGWLRFTTRTLLPEGTTVELTIRGVEPLEVMLDEDILGLPAGAEALGAARGPLATPVQQGDRTTVLGRVTL